MKAAVSNTIEDDNEGNIDVQSNEEGPDLTERLSLYPGPGGLEGDRLSMIDKMSYRNGPIDPNTLGARDLPDIFCDKKHKMKFTYKGLNVKSNEVFCTLCNDEID